MSQTLALELPAGQAAAPAKPTRVTVEQYAAGDFITREPVAGFVFVTDGDNGNWVPGWAYGDQISVNDIHFWSERGYRATHFAMLPAAPVDGVTI